eukprot:m.53054 g.53054  ORF g.53054 m.53054 type:complete len:130 (+) comp10838_c0_seq3:1377-1766(+)
MMELIVYRKAWKMFLSTFMIIHTISNSSFVSYPNLVSYLIAYKNFSTYDVSNMLGDNLLRVLKAAEEYRDSMKNKSPDDNYLEGTVFDNYLELLSNQTIKEYNPVNVTLDPANVTCRPTRYYSRGEEPN